MLSLQPLLLGLVLLSRRLWALGGILIGAAIFIIVLVETYTELRTREPGVNSLTPATRESLDTFTDVVCYGEMQAQEPSGSSPSRSRRESRPRRSIASVLDMMAASLAVSPSGAQGPVPLPSESIDDLVSTERAARTHPDAPPQLSIADPADETAGLLYPPELLAPVPLIWLPNDPAGIARSEAYDLHRYHGLEATLDMAQGRLDNTSHGESTPLRRINSRTHIIDR